MLLCVYMIINSRLFRNIFSKKTRMMCITLKSKSYSLEVLLIEVSWLPTTCKIVILLWIYSFIVLIGPRWLMYVESIVLLWNIYVLVGNRLECLEVFIK